MKLILYCISAVVLFSTYSCYECSSGIRTANPQDTIYDIKGVVVSSDGSPIPDVSVRLLVKLSDIVECHEGYWREDTTYTNDVGEFIFDRKAEVDHTTTFKYNLYFEVDSSDVKGEYSTYDAIDLENVSIVYDPY